jgi:hypothetical protein
MVAANCYIVNVSGRSVLVPVYRDDVGALPFYLKSYDHKPPAQRSALPWWSTALVGIILLALAMVPGGQP